MSCAFVMDKLLLCLFHVKRSSCVDICYLSNLSRNLTNGSVSVCINLFAHWHEDVFGFCFILFYISDASKTMFTLFLPTTCRLYSCHLFCYVNQIINTSGENDWYCLSWTGLLGAGKWSLLLVTDCVNQQLHPSEPDVMERGSYKPASLAVSTGRNSTC